MIMKSLTDETTHKVGPANWGIPPKRPLVKHGRMFKAHCKEKSL